MDSDQTIYCWPGQPGIDAAGNHWHGRWDVTAFDGRRHAFRKEPIKLKAATCEGCGKDYCAVLRYGVKGRFCSSGCAARVVGGLGGRASRAVMAPIRAARKAARIASYPMVECRWCKSPFRQVPSKSGRMLTCSTECAAQRRAQRALIGGWADGNPRGNTFCKIIYCEDCGDVVRSRAGCGGRCDTCRQALSERNAPAKKQKAMAQKRRARHEGRVYKPEKLARYRASGKPVEKGLTWQTVALRDGMNCGYCGRTCSKPDSSYARDSASLGHIFPLSKGGPHAALNCRIECKQCNDLRFNHIDSEARWWRWIVRGTPIEVGPSPFIKQPRARRQAR